MIKNKKTTIISLDFWRFVSEKWAQKVEGGNIYNQIEDAPIKPMKRLEEDPQFDPFNLDDI
jgi:hypothetical protein